MGQIHKPFYDDEAYYSDKEYVSNSMLGRLEENPHKFAMWRRGQYEYPSPYYFTTGRYFHVQNLEPHKLDEQFGVCKLKTRTSAGFKAFDEELKAVGKRGITITEAEDMEKMTNEVQRREALSYLISIAEPEVPYISEMFGVPIKGKLDLDITLDSHKAQRLNDLLKSDRFYAGMRIVGDLKTTGKDVSSFAKSARNFDYDRQACMYMNVADADEFFFIPVEKSFPYTPALFWAGDDFLGRGYYKLQAALEHYKRLFIDGGYSRNYLYVKEL